MRILLSNKFLIPVALCGSVLAILLGTTDIGGSNPSFVVFNRWRWFSGSYIMTLVTFLAAYTSIYFIKKEEEESTSERAKIVTMMAFWLFFALVILPFSPIPVNEPLDALPAIISLYVLHGAIFYLIVNRENKSSVGLHGYVLIFLVVFITIVFSRSITRFQLK